MRTTPAILIVFAFATGILMFQMSGVAAIFDSPDPTSDLQTGEELDERGNETILDSEGEEFEPDARGDTELLGFIIGGLGVVFNFVTLLVLFPVEMHNLGVPWYAAYPVGLLMQILGVFGIVMMAMGRYWQ